MESRGFSFSLVNTFIKVAKKKYKRKSKFMRIARRPTVPCELYFAYEVGHTSKNLVSQKEKWRE